ncbi:MAG: hypothetical protein LBG46_04000 [Elusimicrobiota bacterium]|jgi:hypothetical protein|nr:hypothetical protein [Elusimicrobiota bacterium]
MKKLFLPLILLQSAALCFALTPKDEMIFKAMQDEMRRSMSELKMDNMPRPYFITYFAEDFKGFTINAQNGSLTNVSEISYVDTKVSLRVGSYKEDNSFFNSYIYASSDQQYPSLSYDGLRAGLWDQTNKAYKDALAILAKKQAYKKNKNISDNSPDFSPAKPAVYLEDITPPEIDDNYWQNLARELSAQGNIKELDKFGANINIRFFPSYFISSEGSKYAEGYYYIRVYISAEAKTKAGFELKESKELLYADFKDVPSKEELIKQARAFALQTAELTKAEKAEPYIGPVLLEGSAAASLFYNKFIQQISSPKPVLSEQSNPYQGELTLKKGLKILPADFDVIDDPLASVFNGKKLLAGYKIDNEGVLPQKINLITNGKLTALPATRSLFEGQKESNGHAKAGRDLFWEAGVRNIFVKPHNPIASHEFKNKFLEYCRQESLDYCYIIKSSPFAEYFSAYKIDAKTGRETPVYGAVAENISTRTLRDIKYASDDTEVYNVSTASIVTPSLILSEIEIKPTQKPPARKPLIPKP